MKRSLLQLNGDSEVQRKDLRKRRAKDREKARATWPANQRLGGGGREGLEAGPPYMRAQAEQSREWKTMVISSQLPIFEKPMN